MGIDKSLSDRYPSIIINGSKYHYGKTSEYGSYLVENASIAKDYWYFKEEVDLRAFLTNLPESADRNLRRRLHPDWTEVTHEQRDVYFEQDKLLFRAWAEEKVRNGTAHFYDMDLEGKNGPHEPQQIAKPGSQENPVERVERNLREGGVAGGLSEAGKLRMIEGEIDWDGVSAKDKERILSREVDFKRVTPRQFDFVYEDIAHDKYEPADATVARKLFEAAHDPKLPSALRVDLTDPGYGMALEEEANRARSKFPPKAKNNVTTPVAKAEIEIRAIKGRENNQILAPTDDLGLGEGWTVIGNVDLGKWTNWSEPQRLAVLEDMVPWEGVDPADKRRILEREVDFSRVAPDDQRQILGEVWNQNDAVPVGRVPQDEPESPPDDRVVRPLTQQVIDCAYFDVWPGNAAVVDFGIDSDRHLGALQFAIREGLVTPQELDAAVGNGEKLTEIAPRGDNPYRDVTFKTSWDEMGIEPESGGSGSESAPAAQSSLHAELQADYHAARVRDYGPEDAATYEQRVKEGAMQPPPAAGPSHPWPSEIAKANRHKQPAQDQGKSSGKEKSNGKDGGHSM
jgi:hypothetical protein